MDDLELLFKNVKICDIYIILEWLNFNQDNIITSHFYFNDKDFQYKDIENFENYFKIPGTCNIFTKNITIGFMVEEAIIVIAGDDTSVDITINFSIFQNSEEIRMDSRKLSLVLNRLGKLIHKISYSHIYFGYEPAEDQTTQLLMINNFQL